MATGTPPHGPQSCPAAIPHNDTSPSAATRNIASVNLTLSLYMLLAIILHTRNNVRLIKIYNTCDIISLVSLKNQFLIKKVSLHINFSFLNV
jgi:hypothetical protein